MLVGGGDCGGAGKRSVVATGLIGHGSDWVKDGGLD